jgi:tRNA-dihydrouridine synthase B
MRIGHHQLRNRLIAAPMAGITDRPFRTLCYEMGAGLTVSEMMSSNPQVWESDKSRLRMVHIDEPGIRTVQIAGSVPEEMADAARINVESGAQIIDINMGCPAKKVNRKLAGSALLQYPDQVKSILTAVVSAVDVPVTLKIRTGWSPEHRNCVEIAQLAEDCGIQALTIHGRTRACLFNGDAEYDSIRAVKQKVSIPVIANGDITDPLKARAVLDYTGADALMIGRAAQGRPWIFREIQLCSVSYSEHLNLAALSDGRSTVMRCVSCGERHNATSPEASTSPSRATDQRSNSLSVVRNR